MWKRYNELRKRTDKEKGRGGDAGETFSLSVCLSLQVALASGVSEDQNAKH